MIKLHTPCTIRIYVRVFVYTIRISVCLLRQMPTTVPRMTTNNAHGVEFQYLNNVQILLMPMMMVMMSMMIMLFTKIGHNVSTATNRINIIQSHDMLRTTRVLDSDASDASHLLLPTEKSGTFLNARANPSTRTQAHTHTLPKITHFGAHNMRNALIYTIQSGTFAECSSIF